MDKNFYSDQYWLEYFGGIDLPQEVETKIKMLEQHITHPDPTQNFSGSTSSAFNPLENPQVPNTHEAIRRRDNKRKADQKYRAQQKESKKILEGNYQRLGEENKRLKTEKETLTREKDEMKEGLASAKNEAKKLTREMSDLRRKGKSQEVLVESYSQTILNVDDQQELRDLKVKAEAMSSNREEWMIEKEHLSKHVLDLEHQNKLFQVQIQALCLRIIKTPDSDQDN